MIKKIIATALTLLAVLTFSTTAHADSMKYSVQANLPENQRDKELTYFDLRMKPGQSQDLSLTIVSGDKEPIKVIITPTTAGTNQNGVLDYTGSQKEKDSSLTYSFSELSSDQQIVELKPGETKKVTFTIKMPDQAFDGTILGGFYIKKEPTETDKKEKKGKQLNNTFSYIVGAQLTETDTPVKPDLKLNKAAAGLSNYRPVINANIQNSKAVILKGLDINATVTNDKNEVVATEKKSEMAMAPNSNFDFPISTKGEPLKPGKYTVAIQAKDKDGKHKWNLKKEFEVTAKEAKELNKEAIDLKKDDSLKWKIMIGVIVGLFIVLLVGIWFFMKQKEKKRKQAAAARRKKKGKKKRPTDTKTTSTKKKTKKRPPVEEEQK